MSMSYREIAFVADAVGERLDKALAAHLKELSRAQIQHLIRDGLVTVNDRLVKPSYRIEGGERIRVRVPQPEADQGPQPERIPLDILYEDDDVVAINKPAGMVVHPAYGHTSGTLVNAVLARWPQVTEFSEPDRAGIVHRLDKETSGIILVAKTRAALDDMRAQFRNRVVRKRYLALVEGTPDTPDGLIDAPIGRDPQQRKRMAVKREGREAITEYHVLEVYADYSLLELYPMTGRTHQIRAHLAFIGHPVVGDTVYGRRKQGIKMKRHFLHSSSVILAHPATGQSLEIDAPLPVGLQNILDKLPR
jgi:23S rRNA pseudouridine1911/1915/1917 synthase